MTLDEAVLVLGQIGVYFPRAELPKLTLMAWAREVEAFDRGDLEASIVALGRTSEHEPRLAQVIAGCYQAREQRLERERAAWRERQPKLAQVRERKDPASDREGLAKVKQAHESVGKPMEGA